MKNTDKNRLPNSNTAKVESTISVDKKLDKIKTMRFVSNKIEEVNKLVHKLELSL